MKATLMILGACVLAPVAGGFAGAAINTTPLEAAGDPLATIPRHETGLSGAIDAGAYDTPDHYPLITPRGTVPVEELVFHGRPAYYAGLSASGEEYAPSAPDDDPSAAAASDYGDESRRDQLAPAAALQAALPEPASHSATYRAKPLEAPLATAGQSAAAPTSAEPDRALLAHR